jgi:riboflavin synthase
MFTGLIETLGLIRRLESAGEGVRLEIEAPAFDDVAAGDSIAVNGCCLTAVTTAGGVLGFECVPETLRRTTLGGLAAGMRVNLERSLRLDQRLGGHLVQGHVDRIGDVQSVVAEGEGKRIAFRLDAETAPFVAEKGSIAVDGTSLTVAAVGPEHFEVAYIPYTLEHTVAGGYRAGTKVNLEVDLVARYVARLLGAASREGARS